LKLDGQQSSSIYIHIPFCKRECYYCNFSKLKYESGRVKEYNKFLCDELILRGEEGTKVQTIYFGGGSPAIIRNEYLENIIDTIHDNFNTGNVSEMTIEINPEECISDKLTFLKNLGFNRISIGVQSFNKNDLKYLSRNHTAVQSEKAVEKAGKAGFENISVDFIIGLPNQTCSDLKKNIAMISSYNVPHVSAYILEGVKNFLGRNIPDSEHQSLLYQYFREEAAANGFKQYEVSNFCKSGKVSKHNLRYWQGEEYIGTGLSASGYKAGIDYKNYSNMKTYTKLISNKQLPIQESERHDTDKRNLITGFRLVNGIDKRIVGIYEKKIKELVNEGLITETKHTYKIAPKNLILLNEILVYLL